MNKIIIPSIFAGIVIVAAAFAVMPIEKASTVHTTIQATTKTAPRGFTYSVEGGNTVKIIEAGIVKKADAVVTNQGSGGTCTLEDLDATAIGTAAPGAGVSAFIDVDADTDFAVGEGLQVDPAAGAMCEVTLVVKEIQ